MKKIKKKKFKNKKYEKIINEGYTNVLNSVLFNTDISDGAKNLYLIMLALCIKGDEIEHSQKTLSTMIGKSVRTVQRYLKELKEAGLLEIFFRLGRTNIYKILVKITKQVKEVVNQVRENIQYQKDIFKEKARNALFPPTQRKYDVNVLEEQLLRASRQSHR
ncbi:MAG TPA: helix-turn-helix domain-containing protein [Thermoanaerobacterium sp.]|nr:helix-turn-helix domain-containing protein [Thermoanaerobacterium sp.]